MLKQAIALSLKQELAETKILSEDHEVKKEEVEPKKDAEELDSVSCSGKGDAINQIGD